VLLAVGESLWGKVDDRICRMSTGLAGGLGCSHEELCGTLSAGVLIIGATYGRIRPDEDDGECNRRVNEYRLQFEQRLGAARCSDLRASGYGSDGKWPCSLLVERATSILCRVFAG
jgi:C_GCAxxG_C_C family probable redox protein